MKSKQFLKLLIGSNDPEIYLSPFSSTLSISIVWEKLKRLDNEVNTNSNNFFMIYPILFDFCKLHF